MLGEGENKDGDGKKSTRLMFLDPPHYQESRQRPGYEHDRGCSFKRSNLTVPNLFTITVQFLCMNGNPRWYMGSSCSVQIYREIIPVNRIPIFLF